MELTQQEKVEIKEAVEEIVSNPLNWEQKVVNYYNDLKAKRPLSAKVFLFILCTIFTILVNVTSNMITETIRDTKLKKQPTATSQTIITIEKNQTVYILNKAPYYYEIEFTNETTGKTVTGWLSKRTVKSQFPKNDKSDNDKDISAEY